MRCAQLELYFSSDLRYGKYSLFGSGSAGLGEAANKTSDECRNRYSNIAWDDMVGMRNRLIHAYFDINLNIVWRTVNEELPPLISELESILSRENDKFD